MIVHVEADTIVQQKKNIFPIVSSINIVQNIVNIKFNWHHGLHCCFGTSIFIIITVNNMAYKVFLVHVHLLIISAMVCISCHSNITLFLTSHQLKDVGFVWKNTDRIYNSGD